MSIVVTKCSPEVVVPSEPATPAGNIIELSLFDTAGGCVMVPSLLVFDKPIVDPVGTIRRGLSRALAHYGPIAGRLAAGGADGRGVIACTGEGVVFVGALASCAVEEVLSPASPASASALLGELFVRYPDVYVCRRQDPLLQVQVTEFACGGFVVGVSWNHVVADGAGMAQFLRAVGELARGMPLPSIVPAVRSDQSVLAARNVGALDFSCPPELTQGMAFLDLTIPSSLISRVKTMCACTAFEAVVALLWRCRARAVSSTSSSAGDDGKPAVLSFGCNVRGHVGAAEGYYGNCVHLESVAATTAEVANGDINDVVRLIKNAKRTIQDKMKAKVVDDSDTDTDTVRHQVGYSTLMVTSWRNMGLEAPDFGGGGGGAARVMWYFPEVEIPLCFICPPCKGKDGVNVLGYLVKQGGHADAFMHHMAAPLS